MGAGDRGHAAAADAVTAGVAVAGGDGFAATALATVLWNWGLSWVPASQAGVFINLNPAVGAALGVWLFHDTFGLASVVGGLLIIVAAVVVSLRRPT